MRLFWYIPAFIGMAVLTGCSKEVSLESNFSPVTIHLVHKVAGDTLELGTPVVNPFGEELTITHFAYYLSNLALVDPAGNAFPVPLQYFLVNESVPASKMIGLMVPEGTYTSLRLLIGVDSARNVSGVQSGALDPANGMFWSWNSGYIFAKLEGKSPVSKEPLENVTYHIGGFKTTESALQMVALNFPEPLVVKKATRPVLLISADIDTWFTGVFPLRIANEAHCMSPGTLAQQISANYARMFRVDAVIP